MYFFSFNLYLLLRDGFLLLFVPILKSFSKSSLSVMVKKIDCSKSLENEEEITLYETYTLKIRRIKDMSVSQSDG
jgi:hypothetical protein